MSEGDHDHKRRKIIRLMKRLRTQERRKFYITPRFFFFTFQKVQLLLFIFLQTKNDAFIGHLNFFIINDPLIYSPDN